MKVQLTIECLTLATALLLFIVESEVFGQQINPRYECDEMLMNPLESAGTPMRHRKRRSADFDTEYYSNFYVAKSQSDVPLEYRKYIEIDYSGNVVFHLFNGAEVYLVIPKGDELQFMAYIQEGRFRKCTTKYGDNFRFTLSQPLICSSTFTHFNDSIQFEIDNKDNAVGSKSKFSRIVEIDDVNVRFSNYRVLVWNPLNANESTVVTQGCNFQRQVFDPKHEIVRLSINAERNCECGAFISFKRSINVAFPTEDKPLRNTYRVQKRSTPPRPIHALPYTMDVVNGIMGRTLILKGKAEELPEFSIAFLCYGETVEDTHHKGNTPFFVTFRYVDEISIVAGSRLEGGKEWEWEERVKGVYIKGEYIDVKLHINTKSIYIICNDKLRVVYHALMDFSCVNHVQLYQPADRNLRVDEFRMTGQPLPMPVSATFPDGSLKIGQSIAIYLKSENDCWIELHDPSRNDIAFHMKIRFYDKLVIFNDRKGDTWTDNEEYWPSDYPFQQNVYTEITLTNTPAGIRINVKDNGDKLFGHRVENPDFAYKEIRVRGSDADLLYLELSGDDI